MILLNQYNNLQKRLLPPMFVSTTTLANVYK